MNKQTEKELSELKGSIEVRNPEILKEIVQFFQKVITLAINLENIDTNMSPRLVLGEEPVETDSSKTREYDRPTIYISLARRAPTGVNNNTMVDLFSNNLISGIPKFDRVVRKKIIDENGTVEEYDVLSSLFKTDNEIILSLKTKTVKEQLTLLPLLERALNLYSQPVKPYFVDVCGIKNIETLTRKDNTSFETAKITFQLRILEQVTFDDTYILKGFEILGNDEDFQGIITNTGKIDETGNWTDNVTKEYDEYFGIKNN